MLKKIRNESARILRGLARRVEIEAQGSAGRAALGHNDTETFMQCLSELGFSPRHVVDVGAHYGTWTREAMAYFPSAVYTLFEPQTDLLAESDLKSKSGVKIFAMGAGPKTSSMFLSKHSRKDSFSFALTKEEASAQGREQVEAPVVALDEFLPSRGLPYPDLIKIDAEGWDLEVLKGAEKCCANAEVVLLEASVMNKMFPNSLETVISEMSQRGFVLFDITEIIRTQRHGALWLVEAAFVKKGGKLDSAVATYA